MAWKRSGVQIPVDPPNSFGLIAQLGERCVRNAEVAGSNPARSTRFRGPSSSSNSVVPMLDSVLLNPRSPAMRSTGVSRRAQARLAPGANFGE